MILPATTYKIPFHNRLCHQSRGLHVSGRHSQRARRLSYFLRDGTQLLCLFGQHAEVQTARCHCLRRTRDAKQQANIISKHTHYSIISISIITLTLIVAVIILSYKKRKQKPNNRTEKEMLYKAGLVLFEQSEVYNKMTLIIRSHKEKAESEIMHQGDWLQLIAETNKCWNNIARELQSKYHLTEDEIYLCCLYLTNLPISHFCHILSCERDTIYKRQTAY